AETRAVLNFVETRIIAAPRPKRRGEAGLGPDVTLPAALEAAVPFVEQSFKDQPLTQARLRITFGDSVWKPGGGKAAAAQYEPARAIYAKLLGPRHHNTLVAMNQVGISYGMQGRTRDSVKLYEELFPLCKAELGRDHQLTLACMNNLGMGYYELEQ